MITGGQGPPVQTGQGHRRRLRGTGPARHDVAGDRERFAAFSRSRDPELRNDLVNRNLGLAQYLARRFVRRGESLDDLEQVAALALIKAVDRFDPDRGAEFATFATPTILGELKRHFRDRGWAVRVPRRILELHQRIDSMVDDLTGTLGRAPTVSELAAASGATEDEVIEGLEAGIAYRVRSLDAPGDDDGTPLAARLGKEDERLAETEQRATLIPLIARFPARERLILSLRFFEQKTQSEIADLLGISQMHVSRLLNRALARMRVSFQV